MSVKLGVVGSKAYYAAHSRKNNTCWLNLCLWLQISSCTLSCVIAVFYNLWWF